MAGATGPSTASAGTPAPSTAEEKVKQENVHISNLKKQKSRHRASVACASCRDRRIRCVVPEGETECTQCKRANIECIIKNDDERRRPISRAYMCSLTDRVSLLENMLREKGTEPPPANHPPKTRHAQKDQESSPQRSCTNAQPDRAPEQSSSPGSQQEDFFDVEHSLNLDSSSPQVDDVDSISSPPVLTTLSRKEGMVKRLLSTRGHLSFDQLSGRLRYFGPTTNCHVHGSSDHAASMEESRESLEQARRAEKTIRMLSLETYDYLMDLFWQNYNSVLHVIHQEAFNEDRENGRTQFYSGFLHICILAMGYRFADKTRADMQRIALPQRESTLHREAKYMLDYELERPGGITSVAALLLLGDLECGVGRDNLGWMYAGMAVRLAFDIGLHLDSRNSGLSDREVELRQMTLWACVIYDKYWALFLGRPTSMKSSDLEIYQLAKQFERLGTCRPAGIQKNLETQIYEALLDLMELAGKIVENTDLRSQADANIDRNSYLRMAALDREFSSWYSRLPDQLRWTPANIRSAPYSFFLLHQQYHSALILLHRPYAMYEDPASSSSEEDGEVSADSHFSALSRTVCTKHAIKVARIFYQHRQRFNTRQIFVTGIQHAGTAATALVAALAFLKDPSSRNDNMQYLEVLAASLNDMAYTYQPAERMAAVLTAVMAELRGVSAENTAASLYRPTNSVVPARRGSAVLEQAASSSSNSNSKNKNVLTHTKRRQTSVSKSRPNVTRPTRSASFSIPSNPFDLTASYHRPGEPEHDQGYVMVTPRSEISNWASGRMSNRNVTPASAIDPALMTPNSNITNNASSSTSSSSAAEASSLATTSAAPSSRNANAWMGATEVDSADMSIAHLASIHFPELPNLAETPPSAGSSLHNGNEHLDFMHLGDDWKDWQGGGGQGELEGFGGSGFGFSLGGGTSREGRFGSVLS